MLEPGNKRGRGFMVDAKLVWNNWVGDSVPAV